MRTSVVPSPDPWICVGDAVTSAVWNLTEELAKTLVQYPITELPLEAPRYTSDQIFTTGSCLFPFSLPPYVDLSQENLQSIQRWIRSLFFDGDSLTVFIPFRGGQPSLILTQDLPYYEQEAHALLEEMDCGDNDSSLVFGC